MAHRLRNGLQWLKETLLQQAAVTIIYRRGEDSQSMSALLGETKVEQQEVSGLTVAGHVLDVLVDTNTFAFDEPRAGDQIEMDEKVYEVMNLGDMGCWRYSDAFGTMYRIHTKCIS